SLKTHAAPGDLGLSGTIHRKYPAHHGGAVVVGATAHPYLYSGSGTRDQRHDGGRSQRVAMQKEFLSIRGRDLVNQAGETVTLRGFGLGGWMNMENFITGYPANEEAMRDALHSVLGTERYERFFDCFLQ